jgi:hypothetical protein
MSGFPHGSGSSGRRRRLLVDKKRRLVRGNVDQKRVKVRKYLKEPRGRVESKKGRRAIRRTSEDQKHGELHTNKYKSQHWQLDKT